MNYRLNTRALLIVGVLVLIAIGLFAYTLVSAPTQETQPPEVETPAAVVEERLITAQHKFEAGIHEIAGMVDVPSPCHTLVAESFLLENDTVVEVRFSTLLEGEECPQQIDEVPFHVTFEADEGVAIQATWNGTPVRLNLVPLAPGEELDVELYIKG